MKLKHCAVLLASAALAWPFVVSAENYHWDSVAIGGGGFVTGLIPAKSEAGVFYARTDVGGAYRWNPATSRWIALNDWTAPADIGLMGIESLAVDPHNAAKVYMVAGTSYYNNGKTAVLRSSDYGATFTVTDVSTQFKAHGNGMGRQNGEKLQVDPGNGNLLYAGTRRDGLFRSSDAGASWSKLTSFPVTSTPNDNGVSFVLLDAASVQGSAAQRIFVGVSRLPNAGPNLYVSANGGASFSAVTGGPANLMPQRAAIAPNGKLYITYANGAGPHPGTNEAMDAGQIWEYNAANGVWTNITPSGFSRPFGGISIDPTNPQRLVAATINTWMQQGTTSNYGDRIFISTNAGRNWTDVIQRGFAVDPKGASWINNSAIHWTGSIEFDPSDTNKVWVISGNGVFRTPNINASTTTWAFDVAGLEETVPFNFISIPNGPLVSVIGDFDGFSNANPAQYGTRFTPTMGTTTDLAVAALDTRIMARVGNDLYTTTNSGASWTKAAALNGGKGQLALSADGFALLHTPADTSTTYRSTNYGASWVQVTGLNARNARPVADPVNPSKFYAYDNGRLLASV
ncbi:MAG: exo-alpha-sialidase, partial [Duganella sp.]